MDEEKDLLDAVKIALILGIVATIAFSLYMRDRIHREEQFSEVYFNDHSYLPKKIRANESEEISFTILNQKLDTTTYIYEIDSKTGKHKENITLLPGQRAKVHLTVKPEGNLWSLNLTTEKTLEKQIDAIDDDVIAQETGIKLRIDNKTFGRYLPISHNITGFGYVYHTNLTVDELGNDPFRSNYSNYYEDNNKSLLENGSLILYSEGGKIFLGLNEYAKHLSSVREPFMVKFYEANSSSNKISDIHFWYGVG